jgi:RNA polymerase sigma-70 factor (ECF subfamily)
VVIIVIRKTFGIWDLTFQQLYTEYSNLSYNLALQYLQNKEDAEEVVQDVFVSIHQNLSKFENQSTYSTWIYRITTNKCLDFIKAQKRKKGSPIFNRYTKKKVWRLSLKLLNLIILE